MQSDLVACLNCGANHIRGAQCPYCGSSSFVVNSTDDGDSVDINDGSLIGLPDNYVIERLVGIELFVVKNTENALYKYGLYNAEKECFELEPVFSSIIPSYNGKYIATVNTKLGNGKISSKTIEFTTTDGFNIISSSERTYQQTTSKGCLSIILIIIAYALVLFIT